MSEDALHTARSCRFSLTASRDLRRAVTRFSQINVLRDLSRRVAYLLREIYVKELRDFPHGIAIFI